VECLLSESKEEAEKRHLRELEGKNISHYSVLLQAWIDTRMERDKTLVTLSAAGIGLLVTILTTVGVPYLWVTILYAFSFIGFLVTIWTSLQIYQRNSVHIENELRGKSEKDHMLETFDRLSLKAFLTASIFAISIGLVSASSHFIDTGVDKMAKKVQTPGGTRSLNGIGNLRPSNTQSGSTGQEQGQNNSGSSSGSSNGSGNSN
jgi:hypothetical protein